MARIPNNQRTSASSAEKFGGQELKQLFSASTAWLERHRAYINSLNVFPVPDGDSGTNMLLTMQAAIKEVGHRPTFRRRNLQIVIPRRIARRARKLGRDPLPNHSRIRAGRLKRKMSITAQRFCGGDGRSARTAYKGVVKPVEGTILTVFRESADAATIAATQSDDMRLVLAKTVEAARVSGLKTPMLLPVLKEAGVVDAGGQGLLVILEGALKYFNGEPMDLVGDRRRRASA